MRVPKIGRRLRRAGLLVGLVAVLAACGNDNGQNSLDPKGPYAEKIDNLFIPILILAIVIGIAVLGATVFFAIKFRYREGKPDNPKQIHGSTPLEIGWTIVPALILAVVAVPTIATIFDLAKKPTGPNVLNVTVSGKQWWWQFELPKQPMVDKKVVTSTELHIPVNTKVYLRGLGQRHPLVLGPRAQRQEGRDAGPDEPQHDRGEQSRHLPRRVRGVLRALARGHALPGDRADRWPSGKRGSPASNRARRRPWTGQIKQLTATKYACTNCHVFDDSTKTNYGPNLTHLDSRSTFAGGTYEVNRKNLTNWVMNAPSMIAMASTDCRLPPPATCVGMPSFTKNTPKGQPVMTQADADTIVTYLLGEK